MSGDLVVTGATRPDGSLRPPIGITGGRFSQEPPSGAAELDVDGASVVPGYIDTQVNGGWGSDFTADPGSIWDVASKLPRHGVTAFVPTIISSAPDTVREAQRVLAKGPPASWSGAVPLGLHCEGPMIAAARRGTHPAGRLQPASPGIVEDWGGTEMIRMVTLAAELEGVPDVIAMLRDRGVVVSIGHSDCDARQAMRAFEAGATAVTHLFNAMSGLDHRRPGLAAAALSDASVVAGMIVDGVHIDPVMVALAARLLGPERLALVTDSMAATGLGDGTYDLGEVSVRVDGPRAMSDDTTLAGSISTMDANVRNLSIQAAWPLEWAIRSATATPAELLQLPDRGRIAPACAGDLVVLDDAGNVLVTVVAGEILEDLRPNG